MVKGVDEPTLFSSIEYNKNNYPEETAFLFYEKRELCRVTNRDFFYQVAGCRNHYFQIDITRIGILGTNSYEWICNALGLLAAEKTVALLDPLLPAEDLLAAICRTDLEMLVVDETLPELWNLIQERLPQITLVGYWQESDNSIVSADTGDWKEGEAIFFSSGTSQTSKAVVTPTASIYGNVVAQKSLASYDEGDVVLHPLPYHHSYGFSMLCLYHSANCAIFISSMKGLLSDVRNVRPDRLVLVPSAVEFLLKRKVLSYVSKSIVVAASYFSTELAASVRECGIFAQNLYGSSELPAGIAVSLPEDEVDAFTLHNSVNLEIADDGEIIVANPYHFREYYRDPGATSSTLRNGKVYTGDIGYLDEVGRLHLTGRKKNLIVMENGDKILCTDVDEGLSRLPGVAQAAVIYIDSHLIAVISKADAATEEEVLQAVAAYNSQQPYYRRIWKTWIYSGSLPYTSSGKLHRSRLEREYLKYLRNG